MQDVIITGASRGIGRALACALPTRRRLWLVARDEALLAQVRADIEARGGSARVVPGDLGNIASARRLGRRLAEEVAPGATLIHNAGLWPSRRTLQADGLESAFVVNHLAPLALQEPLLSAQKLQRVLVIGAGLMIKGRFDAKRTPTGLDFSGFRTYCTTKLCFALAMRKIAAAHPQLDALVVHPGVVRTELGARSGLLGALLALVKRRWEEPSVCAARLLRILQHERWSPPGQASYWIEETPSPWPAAASDEEAMRAVWETSAALLSTARYAERNA